MVEVDERALLVHGDRGEHLGHEAGHDQKARLLAMAWSVAGADGTVHEFEEALVWRLGGLLGFDEAGIVLARAGDPLAALP